MHGGAFETAHVGEHVADRVLKADAREADRRERARDVSAMERAQELAEVVGAHLGQTQCHRAGR
jgi:hypothetical protein